MRKLKYIITLCGLLTFLSGFSRITGEWKLHPTFDNSVTKVIETPGKVYFLGYNQTLNPDISFKSAPDLSLFYFDKEGEEMVSVAQRHDLARNAVRFAEYNPDKGYLFITYDDFNIDLLHDSGAVVNIPVLKNANIPGSKQVRAVSFDAANNLIYAATDFGYLAINDETNEVAESRNYSTQLSGIARVGDTLWIASGGKARYAPVNSRRQSINDYTAIDDFTNVARLFPLDSTRLIIEVCNGKNYSVNVISKDADGNITKLLNNGLYNMHSLQPAENGYIAIAPATTIYYTRDFKYQKYQSRPEEDKEIAGSSSWNQTEFYTIIPRKGLRSFRVNSDGSFSLTRDFTLPNAPNAYYSRAMAWHPRYGMLVNSHGSDPALTKNSINEPILLSALKNGEWSPLSPAYRNSSQLWTGFNPLGLAIDPDNDKYIYSGSNFSGLTRLNLDDPEDILHFTYPDDGTANLPGYVKAAETLPSWKRLCTFSNPTFDSNKILWTHYFDQNPESIEVRYWLPDDRRASVNAASARQFKSFRINTDGLLPEQNHLFLPLKASVNKNMLLYFTGKGILIYDHNGTLDNTSDDKCTVLKQLSDQDGGFVELFNPSSLYEDPTSGIVWLGNSTGIYYFTPRNMLIGQAVLNRVKLARNDGTNLADYLLSGVGVNAITTDASGRKWIGTIGAGIIVTNSDGHNIIDEFTTINSPIPSDNIYMLEYNPDNRSMMISTDKGIVEFFIAGSSQNNTRENGVRAYPNPVAPDYFGWVTIDNLPENSLVKIVDSQGNIVRELGRSQSGSAQWDVNNLHGDRVRTGVYYIMSSSDTSEGQANSITKILVMN